MPVQLPLVREYLRESVVSFHPDTPLGRAIDQLVSHRISGAPVLDAVGNVVGVFSELDALRAATSDQFYGRFAEPEGVVGDHMTKPPITVSADADVFEVVQHFVDEGVKRVFVVEHGTKLLGVVSRVDVLAAIRAAASRRPETPTAGGFAIKPHY